MSMSSDFPSSRRTEGSGLFRPALELLVAYARLHRDRRNIQTHLIAVPMGVVAIALLMRGPVGSFDSAPVTPAWVMFGIVCAWYLTRGQLRLGIAASAFVGALVFAAHAVPAVDPAAWLAASVGMLMLSSLLQMIGHYYEGRRPASWGHPVYLLVGPMFVAVELLSGVGLLRRVAAEVHHRAGPSHIRDLAHPLPLR
jgi:uncharacterized membrane protein YGL010W